VLWLGHQLKPLLAPLALRARPMPFGAMPLTFGMIVGALAVLFGLRRRQ
jgi:hypothetical protein